jgi:hypothetical protein
VKSSPPLAANIFLFDEMIRFNQADRCVLGIQFHPFESLRSVKASVQFGIGIIGDVQDFMHFQPRAKRDRSSCFVVVGGVLCHVAIFVSFRVEMRKIDGRMSNSKKIL